MQSRKTARKRDNSIRQKKTHKDKSRGRLERELQKGTSKRARDAPTTGGTINKKDLSSDAKEEGG